MSGLAKRAKLTRRERQAQKYEDVLEQIDAGGLEISGADPAAVSRRLRDKAKRARAGASMRDLKRG